MLFFLWSYCPWSFIFFYLRFLSHAFVFFFFNDTATTEIYTLSLHDALPICSRRRFASSPSAIVTRLEWSVMAMYSYRSEEHTSEIQSLAYLVCRLLLEKKKTPDTHTMISRLVHAHAVVTAQRHCESPGGAAD